MFDTAASRISLSLFTLISNHPAGSGETLSPVGCPATTKVRTEEIPLQSAACHFANTAACRFRDRITLKSVLTMEPSSDPWFFWFLAAAAAHPAPYTSSAPQMASNPLKRQSDENDPEVRGFPPHLCELGC